MSYSRTISVLAPEVVEANLRDMLFPRSQMASIDFHGGYSKEQALNSIITSLPIAAWHRWDRMRFVTGTGKNPCHAKKNGESGILNKKFKGWFTTVQSDKLQLEEHGPYYEVIINRNIPARNLKVSVETIECLERKALSGDELALLELGYRYSEGKVVNQSFKKANFYLSQIENSRSAIIQFEVAGLYYIGLRSEKNDAKALQLFTSSADQGYAAAAFVLADIHRRGIIGAINLPLAHKFYLVAAVAGHPEAARRVGCSFNIGCPGIEKNRELAFYWLKIGVERKDATAALILSIISYETDKELSLEYLALAAEMGEPDGQLHYGMQLLFGNSFELITNPERGLHWIQQSANQQHPDALYLLFRISAQQQNVTLSGHYFIRAAEAGCVDAQCYFLLNSNEEIQRISPEINVEELRGKIKILFLGQDDDIILEIHDFDINDVVRYLRSDMNDTEYLNKSLSLLEKMAKKQGLTSKPKIKSFIKAFDVPQHKFSQNAPMIHEVKEEIIIDKSYSFRNKTKISDTPFITLLKAQSSLAFFAIKNLSDNIDAVVQCKEENDYARIKQLQTKRKCKGKFFNAKSKKKYFVIEGVNLLSSEEEKHSIPEQTKSNLTRKTTVKL